MKENKGRSCNSMYDEVKKMMDGVDIPSPEMVDATNWFDDIQQDLTKTLSDHVNQFPDEKGYTEATMTAMGRFVCTVLEKIQRSGFLVEGIDIYEEFVGSVLPCCHKLVQDEIDEEYALREQAKKFGLDESQAEEARNIIRALAGTMSEEEIFEKYIQVNDREGFITTLREIRAMIREKQAND